MGSSKDARTSGNSARVSSEGVVVSSMRMGDRGDSEHKRAMASDERTMASGVERAMATVRPSVRMMAMAKVTARTGMMAMVG